MGSIKSKSELLSLCDEQIKFYSDISARDACVVYILATELRARLDDEAQPPTAEEYAQKHGHFPSCAVDEGIQRGPCDCKDRISPAPIAEDRGRDGLVSRSQVLSILQELNDQTEVGDVLDMAIQNVTALQNVPPVVDGWLHIGSAPKGYTPLLLTDGQVVGEGWYSTHLLCWEFANPNNMMRRNPIAFKFLPVPIAAPPEEK